MKNRLALTARVALIAPGIAAAIAVTSVLSGCASNDAAPASQPDRDAMLDQTPPGGPVGVSPLSERDARRRAAYDAAVQGVDFSSGRTRVTQTLFGDAAAIDAAMAEGHAELQVGHRTEAIAAFVRAVRMDDNDPAAFAALADALSRKGEMPGAYASYAAAIELAPTDVDLRYEYAMRRSWSDDRAASIAAFDDVLALAPDHGRAHVRLAILHYYEGDLSAAQRHVSAAGQAGVDAPPQFLQLLRDAQAVLQDGVELETGPAGRVHDLEPGLVGAGGLLFPEDLDHVLQGNGIQVPEDLRRGGRAREDGRGREDGQNGLQHGSSSWIGRNGLEF